MKLAIAVAHAAWQHQRKPALERLLARLPSDVHVQSSDKPEHAWVWARRLWRWAADQDERGGDACVLLNDDTAVCDDFAEVVRAMVEAAPGELLSLHAQGPVPPKLLAQGHAWVRAYNYTGPGVVFQRGHARELLAYWERHPDLQNVKDIAEDHVAAQWSYSVQRPMYLSLPAIVKHDATIPSTGGWDHHAMRVTSVPWDQHAVELTGPKWWHVDNPNLVPWMQCPWFPVASLDAFRRRRKYPADLGPDRCWWCATRSPIRGSSVTGAVICGSCLVETMAHIVGQE